MTKVLGELPPHVAAPDPSLYRSDNYVVLDFETTNLSKGTPVERGNRIVLASWVRGPEGRPQSAFASEYELAELVQACEQADFIVAHNAKFEAGWLKRCGLDLYRTIVFDTLTAEWVIGGNRYVGSQLSLSSCLERWGLEGKEGTVGWMIRQGFPPEEIPRRWLQRYCERDVTATRELFLLQREKLREKQLEAIQYQRCLTAVALADIEFNGMQLDIEAVLKLYNKHEERHVHLENQLTKFCNGIPPSKKQKLGEYIYTELGFSVPRDYRGRPMVTDSGKYSVSAPVMARLVPRTKAQREFIRLYDEWLASDSLLTKYLRKFRDCAEEAEGMLYGSFMQGRTRTHRLSSVGSSYRVQFQNLARDLKPFFTARERGWRVGECDGAQLEFRTAVHLGRDKTGLHYITDEGSDIHKFTASAINNIPETDVTPAQRQLAKNDTFKPLYGGSSGTEEQQRYYAAFKEKYSGIADTQLNWVHNVLRDKSLTTEWGMRYYWPDTKVTESGYVTNTTSIYNYPVQAFATAEIIPIALVCAWHRIRPLESFIVNTVHDSIIAEIAPGESSCWHRLAQQCLIDDVYKVIHGLYGLDITVPLGAGVTIGTHWGRDNGEKAEETVYEASDELWKPAAKKAGML